jgi:hypothetical protein
MVKYANFKIRIELKEEIEQIIENHPELGYTSATSFVRDAIRRHVFYIKKEVEPGQNAD